MGFLKTIPSWLLIVIGGYLIILVSFAVYDGRQVDFWPPTIHSKVKEIIVENDPNYISKNKQLEEAKNELIQLRGYKIESVGKGAKISDLKNSLDSKDRKIIVLDNSIENLTQNVKALTNELNQIKLLKSVLHKWNYRHFKNTQTKELASWVNSLKSNVDDIVSAISGNDFHVWAREGNAKSGLWKKAHVVWNSESRDNIKSGLKHQNRVILGLSGNDFHYLKWQDQ